MKSVLILVIVLKMLIAVLEIIVAFVHAEKDTQEIHMAINAHLVSSSSDLKNIMRSHFKIANQII